MDDLGGVPAADGGPLTGASGPWQEPALTPARRRSLAQDVADQVRTAILHGQLTPGQHLGEEELAGRLQVSRGPVREAFALLEREGLVKVARHRGASVVELSRDDLEELYSLRIGLEVIAAQLGARRAEPADLTAAAAVLGALAEALDGSSLTERDAARLDLLFHDAIYAAARNSRLHASWQGIRSQVHLLLRASDAANPDWQRSVAAGLRDHAGILDAIRARDEATAARLAGEHVAAAYARAVQGVDGGGARPLRFIVATLPADDGS